MTYTQCIDCAYWLPHQVGEDGLPRKHALDLPNGRCYIKLPPYLMKRQLADYNTHQDQGCDLGKGKQDADPQV